MVSSNKIRGIAAAPLAILVSVGGFAGTGNATSPTAGFPVEPRGHATVDPVQLPATPVVGQSATTSAAIQTTLDEGPVSLMLVTTSSITSVSADGSYAAQSIIESLDVTNAPASTDITQWGFGSLAGSSFNLVYASTGAPVRRGARTVDAETLVRDFIGMSYIGFPARPVTVGESWSTRGRVSSTDFSVSVDYQCRLVSVAGEAYTMEVSYAEGFSETVNGRLVEGTVSGTGSLSGSLENPLVISGTLNQTVDGVLTAEDGSSAPLRRGTSVTLDSVG